MASYATLKYGSSGTDVEKLQKSLIDKGYDLGSTGADGVYGSKTQAAVTRYQKDNGLTEDGIAGNQTLGKLYAAPAATSPAAVTQADTAAQAQAGFNYDPYERSDVVKQAEAMLQQQLSQKPGTYQSQWQTQLDEALNKILNREKFTYDLNGDALYQQYKDQYMLQGQQAMMDTMGQAAALTGGYGNTYAQTAGQQTYQGYLQQLNDRVPELYQLALDQYNREGEELYNQYGLYADREEQDYGRYRDSLSDYYTELDRLTEDARYQGEQDYGKYMDGYNMAYGQYRDQVSDDQWMQSLAYQKERDQVADAQWQAEFDEAKRQYDQQYALSAGKAYSSVSYDNISQSDKEALEAYAAAGDRDGLDRYLGMLEAEGRYDPAVIQSLKDVYANTESKLDQLETGVRSFLSAVGLGGLSNYNSLYSNLVLLENEAEPEELAGLITQAYNDGMITSSQRSKLRQIFVPDGIWPDE